MDIKKAVSPMRKAEMKKPAEASLKILVETVGIEFHKRP
jgi:hypothetical protein